MNLLHVPDGSIWVVDFYREIIEDYSAIPRHLQQQYGLYAGHDRGRIYRLTHRDAVYPWSNDLNRLETSELARECGSPLLWRRQTAQRLLVERGATRAAPMLREQLTARNDEPAVVITALRTLKLLDLLAPSDVVPFLRHADAAVRVHALQLADHWFAQMENTHLLDATLDAAAVEQNPRVLVQFALSLGESPDPRALRMLARYAREKLDVRWMDAAILSSVSGRMVDFFAALVRDPGDAQPLFGPLAQAIGAGGNESELSWVLRLIADVPPETQAQVLTALAAGRRHVPRQALEDDSALESLAAFTASAAEPVRTATRTLADTFVVTAADDAAWVPPGLLPLIEPVAEETYREFLAALDTPRDVGRGHELFLQACATCHRVGEEGHAIGPDLLGQIGLGEEPLLREILMPSERIRPGYETTLVRTSNGGIIVGILQDDGATSLTLGLPGGVQESLLRKNLTGVRRLASSLMPSFAEGLAPADVAHLLAWLRTRLQPASPRAP